MGKSQKKEKKKRSPDTRPNLMADYTTLPFAKLHAAPALKDLFSRPHPLRHDYWRLIPDELYSPAQGIEIVRLYAERIESELESKISQGSVAYWLHLYRRLAPGSAGSNKSAATIGLVRAALEAAIQKYGAVELCGHLGVASELTLERILGGVFARDAFLLRLNPDIAKHSTLVLAEFGQSELLEFYRCEKLAYELWFSMATLRALAKGAPLRVSDDGGTVGDDRSDELDGLIQRYDGRQWSEGVSFTGTVFGRDKDEHRGHILLPVVNAGHIPWSALRPFFERYQVDVGVMSAGSYPNFLWLPFDIQGFYTAHAPFASAFQEQFACGLESVLAVIASLSAGVLLKWREGTDFIYKSWQRAYEGPAKRQDLIGYINSLINLGLGQLSLPIRASDVNVDGVFNFLSLTAEHRENMQIRVPGQHAVFLPCGSERFFVDFAWIRHRLLRLFDDVQVEDQNFKGEALEVYVRGGQSELPVRRCKGLDGTSCQIDAAFACGEVLVIGECKSKRRHLGLENGSMEATEGHRQFLQNVLSEVDRRAVWLAHHPTGTNFDISGYRWIFPVGITPFVEFIWSSNPNLWIRGPIPRILTPTELRDFLNGPSAAAVLANHSAAVRVCGC
jgi:hypothetical protein